MPDYPSPKASLGHFPLPKERKSITHDFTIAGFRAYITVGLYDDGKVGEIYISTSKEGSKLNGVCQALAISISIGLQSGVPLERYIEKLEHIRFEPMGFTDNKEIHSAKSIIDYIAKWLKWRFIKRVTENKSQAVSRSTGSSISMPAMAMGCKSNS